MTSPPDDTPWWRNPVITVPAVTAITAAVLGAVLTGAFTGASGTRTLPNGSSSPVSDGSAVRSDPPSTSPAEPVACEFLYGVRMNCQSTNPRAAVYFLNNANSFGCTWTEVVSWGDGTTSTQSIAGSNTGGGIFVANHAYSEPGTYNIQLATNTAVSSCPAGPAAFVFTLRSP